MSTDKLQAIQNTVEEILGEPPSPRTFFDEEADATQAGEQVAKVSDNLRLSTEIAKENVGRPTSRKFGISPNENFEADIARATGRESVDIARQALADQIPGAPQGDAGNQLLKQLSKLSHETASPRSDLHTTGMNMSRTADSGNRISLGRWTLRGFAVILLAAGIGAAVWLGWSRDAAKTAPSQPAALAQAAPAAAVPPELTPLVQLISRDLARVGKEVEQLKADNANLREQIKASQEQLTQGVARLSEQLKVSQEQVARDNANRAEQIKEIQDQLAGVISRASEPNAPPKIAATAPRTTLPTPRPAAPAARKPVPTVSPAQATAQPKTEKPKLSSASRPPPAR